MTTSARMTFDRWMISVNRHLTTWAGVDATAFAYDFAAAYAAETEARDAAQEAIDLKP